MMATDIARWWDDAIATAELKGLLRIAGDLDIEAVADDLAKAGCDVVLLDCSDVEDADDFLDLCLEAWQQPEDAAEDWDDLLDVLVDAGQSEQPAVIVVHWQTWAADEPEQAAAAMDVLGDALRQWSATRVPACVLVLGEGPALGMTAVIGEPGDPLAR